MGLQKPFQEMTRDDVLGYLDKGRKPENEDPLHKWIASYNIKCIILSRFFKWFVILMFVTQEEGMSYQNQRESLIVLWVFSVKEKGG